MFVARAQGISFFSLCAPGAKAIKSKKGFSKVYVVVTAHRFFAMSVSKILKKPEIQLDVPLLDLRLISNAQANRVVLQFDGKDKEIEIQTLQDAVFVKTLRTALARITAGYGAASLPKLDMAPDRAANLIEAVDVGIAGGIVPAYEAFCDYYSVPVSRSFVTYVNDVVNSGQVMIDLTECPGIEANDGGLSASLFPLLGSFVSNTYFKGLSLKNVSRGEVWKAASLIFKGGNNTTLTKLVLRDTNGSHGDAKSFFDSWASANGSAQVAILDVGGNKLDSSACSALSDVFEASLVALSVLSLSECSLPASGVAELMIALSRSLRTSLLLTSLALDGAKFDQDANDCMAFWLSLLGKHGNLQKLSLAGCSGLDLALAFRPFVQGSTHCLTHLDISQNKVDAAFLSSQIIANSKTLRSLKISDCGLSSELFVQIGNAIAANTSLVDFQLVASNNPLGSNAAIVVQALQKCQNITLLDLRGCGFAFSGAQLVLDSVNTLLVSLQSFFIGGVGIGQLKKATPEAIKSMMGFAASVAKALGSHTTLREFGLDLTVMNLKGWKAAFESLPRSRVSRLALGGVQLGDMGMHALCESIRGNTSVLELELDNNRITLNGLLDLRAALRQCRTIVYMPLPSADISAILQSCGKPGTSKWMDVQLVAHEISALIASVGQGRASEWPTTNPANACWELQAPQSASQHMEVPAEILPAHEVPPKYRDRKPFQEWKLSKLEAKLAEMSRAALAGGYVAGAASSGGGGGGGGLSSSVVLSRSSTANPGASGGEASVQFGANTVNLLADLDLGGGGADEYGDEQGAEDDGQWSDQTIRVENKRAPLPSPRFE